MKFDDFVYNILEQERKGGGWGKAALGVGAGAALAAMYPEKAASALHSVKDAYGTHAAPHVNKALGGKSAHAAPTHADQADMGAVPRGRVEPSHADQTHMGAVHRGGATPPPHDPHDIDLPDYGV